MLETDAAFPALTLPWELGTRKMSGEAPDKDREDDERERGEIARKEGRGRIVDGVSVETRSMI